jgi:hypothetical protein
MVDALDEVETILDNPFFLLAVSGRAQVVCLHRTEEPFTSQAEWEGELGRALRTLGRLARPGMRFVYDMRAVRGRNDKAFESSTVDFRRRVLTMFTPTAVVIRTAAGQMQLTRYIREAGSSARIFYDFRVAAVKLGVPLAFVSAIEVAMRVEPLLAEAPAR